MSSHKKAQYSDDPRQLYVNQHSLRLSPVYEKLVEYTKTKTDLPMMLGSTDVLQLLHNLCKTLKAKKALDVGVFTGASSLQVATAMPEDGKVIAMDVSETYTNAAKLFWKEAGVDHKIDLRLAPAVETLKKLIDGGETGTFDMAFIDADKTNYDNYYEYCLKLIRPGGIIAVDNVLWGGKVHDEAVQDESTIAIRALNSKIHKDERVDVSLLNIGDGVTLAFKR